MRFCEAARLSERPPADRRARLCSDFDDYLKSMPKEQLAVVCCMAGYVPQCRRVEPVLELLNGENSQGGVQPSYQLLKFDFAQSRMLKDRHNISTLPMYLMYLGGKLAYASSTLNGFGTSKDDLKKQIATTLAQPKFLPEDFRFGATDNNMVASFGNTINATSNKLATATR